MAVTTPGPSIDLKDHETWRRTKSHIAVALMVLSLALVGLPLVPVLYTVIKRGYFVISWDFLTGSIGPQIAAVLYHEGLYRSFANRREVAAYAGLAPTPWRSGKVAREQGISKAGNPRLRHAMVELAWLWVRHQPDSAPSRWFRARVGQERGRVRRVAIVALARRLLVALWRYLARGEVPEGAALKAT